MIIERRSIITGKINVMDLPITAEMIAKWTDGELIQRVMPHLTPVQREFLISGMNAEEQKRIFGE